MRPARANQECPQFAQAWLVPHKGDAPASRNAGHLLEHACRLVTGCKGLQFPHWRTIRKSGRQQIRGLARSDQGACQHLIDDDLQVREAADCPLELRHAALGQRAQGVVWPFATPLRGNGVANEVEFADAVRAVPLGRQPSVS